MAPGEMADDSPLTLLPLEATGGGVGVGEEGGVPGVGGGVGGAAVLTHPNEEKLLESDGWTAAQAQVGPFDWQKVSKNEVSQPVARHTPHTPQLEQEAIPEQPLLCTVSASDPASMNDDDASENAEPVHMTAAGAAEELCSRFRVCCFALEVRAS